jgi:hypothetical protein
MMQTFGRCRTWAPLLILMLLALFPALINLERIPPLWWDEGWTLSVARNWVEHQHYGLYQNGEPYSAGLSGAFPVIAPIALSFKLFGVGIWQGRIVGLLLTFGALVLLYCLAFKLYNRSVADGTLGVVLLVYGSWQVQTIFWGRQVLGEMPAVFYLLAGYVSLLVALRWHPLFLFVAALMWGIALQTKLQVLPFWLVSMLLPLGMAFFKRHYRYVTWLALGFGGALLVSALLPWVQRWIIGPAYIPKPSIDGLFQATAFVLVPMVRQLAWERVLAYGMPALLGLLYAAWAMLWGDSKLGGYDAAAKLVRLAIWSLAGSWYAWYVFLAIWWERYFFPSIFLSSMFLSAFLYHLTSHYNFRMLLKQAFTTFRRDKPLSIQDIVMTTRGVAGLLVTGWICVLAFLSVIIYFLLYTRIPDSSPIDVARYLDMNTPPGAMIETYESEIMFLVNRPVHFPPENYQVELHYPTYFGIDRPITYDALIADPDYLVTGPYSDAIHLGRLYAPVLASGDFRLIAVFPAYKIYARVR